MRQKIRKRHHVCYELYCPGEEYRFVKILRENNNFLLTPFTRSLLLLLSLSLVFTECTLKKDKSKRRFSGSSVL
jgi:hypothetical protein